MVEEQNDKEKTTEVPETAETSELTSEKEPEAPVAEKEEAPPPTNALAQKRGRMVMAGVLIAVISSIVVVLVAGIFQLTSKVFVICPQDLPINDPARILWQKLDSEKVGDQALGVTGNLADVTKLKQEVAPTATAEETGESPK